MSSTYGLPTSINTHQHIISALHTVNAQFWGINRDHIKRNARFEHTLACRRSSFLKRVMQSESVREILKEKRDMEQAEANKSNPVNQDIVVHKGNNCPTSIPKTPANFDSQNQKKQKHTSPKDEKEKEKKTQADKKNKKDKLSGEKSPVTTSRSQTIEEINNFRPETPSPRALEAKRLREEIQQEHTSFINSYLNLDEVEHKSARQFEMGLMRSTEITEEIACRLQLKRSDQKYKSLDEFKLILKLTNKQCYVEFLAGKITYPQFKQRVFQKCATERGERLNYVILDDLREGLVQKYNDQSADYKTSAEDKWYGKYKRQLQKEQPGLKDNVCEWKVGDKFLPTQKRCIKSLVDRKIEVSQRCRPNTSKPTRVFAAPTESKKKKIDGQTIGTDSGQQDKLKKQMSLKEKSNRNNQKKQALATELYIAEKQLVQETCFLKRIEDLGTSEVVWNPDAKEAFMRWNERSCAQQIQKEAKSLLYKLNSKPRPGELMAGESRIGRNGTEYDSEPQELTESSVRHLVAPKVNISPPPPDYVTRVAKMLKTVTDNQDEGGSSFANSHLALEQAGLYEAMQEHQEQYHMQHQLMNQSSSGQVAEVVVDVGMDMEMDLDEEMNSPSVMRNMDYQEMDDTQEGQVKIGADDSDKIKTGMLNLQASGAAADVGRVNEFESITSMDDQTLIANQKFKDVDTTPMQNRMTPVQVEEVTIRNENQGKIVRMITPTTASANNGQNPKLNLNTVGEATASQNTLTGGDSYILIVEKDKNVLMRNVNSGTGSFRQRQPALSQSADLKMDHIIEEGFSYVQKQDSTSKRVIDQRELKKNLEIQDIKLNNAKQDRFMNAIVNAQSKRQMDRFVDAKHSNRSHHRHKQKHKKPVKDNKDMMISAVTDMNSFTIIDDDVDAILPNSGDQTRREQMEQQEQQIELNHPQITAAFHKHNVRSSNAVTSSTCTGATQLATRPVTAKPRMFSPASLFDQNQMNLNTQTHKHLQQQQNVVTRVSTNNSPVNHTQNTLSKTNLSSINYLASGQFPQQSKKLRGQRLIVNSSVFSKTQAGISPANASGTQQSLKDLKSNQQNDCVGNVLSNQENYVSNDQLSEYHQQLMQFAPQTAKSQQNQTTQQPGGTDPDLTFRLMELLVMNNIPIKPNANMNKSQNVRVSSHSDLKEFMPPSSQNPNVHQSAVAFNQSLQGSMVSANLTARQQNPNTHNKDQTQKNRPFTASTSFKANQGFLQLATQRRGYSGRTRQNNRYIHTFNDKDGNPTSPRLMALSGRGD